MPNTLTGPGGKGDERADMGLRLFRLPNQTASATLQAMENQGSSGQTATL